MSLCISSAASMCETSFDIRPVHACEVLKWPTISFMNEKSAQRGDHSFDFKSQYHLHSETVAEDIFRQPILHEYYRSVIS